MLLKSRDHGAYSLKETEGNRNSFSLQKVTPSSHEIFIHGMNYLPNEF